MSQDTIPLLSSEIDNIISIIESFNDSGLTHLDFTLGDLRIKIDKGETLSAPALIPTTSSSSPISPGHNQPETALAHEPQAQPETLVVSAGENIITSPMIGRFYSQSEPGAETFVSIGSDVSAGTTVGLIEAMKMFNAVSAGLVGVITQICVKDGDLVEYGQPLFHLKPKM